VRIVDEENNGHDAVMITRRRLSGGHLDKQIDHWADQFDIDAAAAKAKLRRLMAEW
jgi:hypothetical protein